MPSESGETSPSSPSNRTSPSSQPRWPALDGLRAIAVILVIGYHSDGFLANGFVGVDIFFVLSGFLITSLLLHEQASTGTIRIGRFYLRRVLRLYPALVALCLAVSAIAIVTRHHIEAVLAGAGATLAYLANIWEYTGNHDTYLLQHTWTLSLEEQFYLVWPVVLLLVARSRWWMIAALGSFIAIELADLLLSQPPALHTYIRAAGLPLGCLAAYAARRGVFLRWAKWLCIPALLVIIVLACAPQRVGAANVTGLLDGWPVGLAAALSMPVVLALTQPGPVTRLLAARWLRWIGQRSYGIYLWHFPILTLAINNVAPSVPVAIRILAAIGLTVLVAAASYRLIEQPFLRLRLRFEPTEPTGGRAASTPADRRA